MPLLAPVTRTALEAVGSAGCAGAHRSAQSNAHIVVRSIRMAASLLPKSSFSLVLTSRTHPDRLLHRAGDSLQEASTRAASRRVRCTQAPGEQAMTERMVKTGTASDEASVIAVVVLAFSTDPAARWTWPHPQQYL